jgi:hypothetical protein
MTAYTKICAKLSLECDITDVQHIRHDRKELGDFDIAVDGHTCSEHGCRGGRVSQLARVTTRQFWRRRVAWQVSS